MERLLDTLSEKIGDEVTEQHMLKARKLKRFKVFPHATILHSFHKHAQNYLLVNCRLETAH